MYVGERCSIVTCPAVGGHRRHQRHRGRAAADDDDLLARVVEVLGPVLRVHDRALEAVGARELRRVRLVVVVVAGAAPQEARRERGRRSVVVDLDGPARGLGVPARAGDPVPVADQLVDAVLLGDGAQVVEDRRPVGQRAVAGPGPPAEAEREHVGVRADAGVPEQVPGAAAGLARLEHRDALGGQVLAQLAGRADAGQPGADDQDVDVLGGGHAAQTIRDTVSQQGSVGCVIFRRVTRICRFSTVENLPMGSLDGHWRAYSSTNRARIRGGSVTTAARARRISSSPSPGSK